MSKWQGKSKGTATGYRIFGFFIKHLGLGPAYLLLAFVTLYYFFFSWKTSVPILDFYRKRLKFSGLKPFLLLYKNYFNLGQSIIDKFAMMAGYSSSFQFDRSGAQNLIEIVKQGEGGILLSGHAGNWEAAGHIFDKIYAPINIIMYEGEEENIKKFLDESEKRRFKIISVKNDLSHIFKIAEVLAANEIVCMHADRFLPGNKTVTANFMGAPAPFPEGPFLLALKFNAPVVYVFGFKETSTRYKFYCSPIKRFGKKNGDSIMTILQDYIADFESKVKMYPAQWFNYYDFWKTDK